MKKPLRDSVCCACLVALCVGGVPPASAQVRPNPPSSLQVGGTGTSGVDVQSGRIMGSEVRFEQLMTTKGELGGLDYALVAQLLERWGFDQTTSAVSAVRFGDLAQGVPQELFGYPIRGIKQTSFVTAGEQQYRTYSYTAEGNFFLGQSKTGQVQGWAIAGGSRYEVRAVPQDSAGRHLVLRMRPDRGTGEAGESPPPEAAVGRTAGQWRIVANAGATPPAETDKCSVGQVPAERPLRVLVGYTPTADDRARNDPFNIAEGARSAADALAELLQGAGISYASVDLIQPVDVVYYTERVSAGLGDRSPLETMVKDLTDSSMSGLRVFREKRRQSRADVGVLIVHQDKADECGWARNIPADQSQAYVVVSWRCLGSRLGMQHEIGHLLGARHADDNGSPLYARALKHDRGEKPFVTVMGYESGCELTHKCVRELCFSNPRATLRGVSLGERDVTDNACAVRINLPKMLQFWQAP